MSDTIRKIEDSFLGSDGVHQIFYTIYEPEEPKAIFQIAHGMAEYFGRYEDFSLFLAENGFVVAGEDHLGHGRTGDAVKEFGYFGKNNLKSGEARNHMIDDMHILTNLLKEEYPGLPVVLMGHSMGSMMTRMYLALYGNDVDAAIVMGTCGTSGSSSITGLAAALCADIGLFKGKDYTSTLISNMAFGSYNDHFTEEGDFYSWLSQNEENRERYHADPWCGFPFTVSAFQTLMELIGYITKSACFGACPDDLPILLISGGDDPVGNYGIGVDEVYRAYRKAGKEDLTKKLYPDLRHEILNEDIRETVYGDILEWVKSRIRF